VGWFIEPLVSTRKTKIDMAKTAADRVHRGWRRPSQLCPTRRTLHSRAVLATHASGLGCNLKGCRMAAVGRDVTVGPLGCDEWAIQSGGRQTASTG
jgi:hypothetical protein